MLLTQTVKAKELFQKIIIGTFATKKGQLEWEAAANR